MFSRFNRSGGHALFTDGKQRRLRHVFGARGRGVGSWSSSKRNGPDISADVRHEGRLSCENLSRLGGAGFACAFGDDTTVSLRSAAHEVLAKGEAVSVTETKCSGGHRAVRHLPRHQDAGSFSTHAKESFKDVSSAANTPSFWILLHLIKGDQQVTTGCTTGG